MAIDTSNTTRTTPPTTPTTAASGAKSTLDYDSFLQLLVTEMKNQDPTDPMKSSDYMAQFASFSSVEQAIQTNNKLDSLLTSSALSQADAVLGHTVTSADGTVTGKVESLKITADGLVATLDDGSQLTLGEGIKIS